MPRRPHGAEAPQRAAVDRHVDAIEDAPRSRRRGAPRARAGDSVRIETSTARLDDAAQSVDVLRIVRERQLLTCCVTPFDVQELVEEVGMLSKRAGNGS